MSVKFILIRVILGARVNSGNVYIYIYIFMMRVSGSLHSLTNYFELHFKYLNVLQKRVIQSMEGLW